MPQDVAVRRKELPAPDLADPNRVMIQIEYQVGELPPRFLYIDKKEWSKEKEAAMIKADLARRMAPPGETIKV